MVFAMMALSILVSVIFCPSCGAPMTDEAMQMVVERMEALHENRD